MQKQYFPLIYAWLILLGVGCQTDVTPTHQGNRHTFRHDGLEREYLFYAPKDLKPNAPLVLVLHGFTSSAQNIMDYSGYNQLAEEHGFAVAYPQGTLDAESNAFWNVGYDFHADSTVDDIGFIGALANFLQQEHSLSRKNTFAVGMSNGAELCYLLACERAESFRAIATVAGTMMNNRFDLCQPSRPLPILSIFGTEDETTRYEGDKENQDGWGAYKSIPSIINFWRTNIDYDQRVTDTLPDLVPEDSSYVIREKYINKDADLEFLYYKVVGGGHDWPGAWGNEDINASVLTWSFFEQHLQEN